MLLTCKSREYVGQYPNIDPTMLMIQERFSAFTLGDLCSIHKIGA